MNPPLAGSAPRLNGPYAADRYPLPASTFGWLGMHVYGGMLFFRTPSSWETIEPMLGNFKAGFGR